MMSPRIALPGIVLSAAMIFGVTLLAAIQTLLRSYQALWETNSVFKRARNLWIRGLGSSLRQAAATVQAAALSVK